MFVFEKQLSVGVLYKSFSDKISKNSQEQSLGTELSATESYF